MANLETAAVRSFHGPSSGPGVLRPNRVGSPAARNRGCKYRVDRVYRVEEFLEVGEVEEIPVIVPPDLANARRTAIVF